MRKRIVVPLLLAALVSAGRAEASTRQRALYASIVALLAVTATGLLASGIALYYAAPQASTLMTFKREDSAAEDYLIPAGAILMIPSLIFTIAGSQLFDMRSDSSSRITLAPVSGALGLGLGGRF